MNQHSAAHIAPGPQQRLIKEGVGASMAATAIGLNPYQRPIDAWLVLTGRAAPFAGNEATFWGQALEPTIRAHYVEKNQVAVYVPPTSLFHADLSWLRATPDGIVVDGAGKWQYVAPQVKSVGLRMAPRWEDGPPEEYIVQAVVEMAVTNLDRLDFAVLIGAQKYEQPTVWRDAELEALTLQQLRDFWRLVELDQQPEVDGSDTFRRHLLGQIKKRQVVDASSADVERLEKWRDITVSLAKLKAAEKQVRNEVVAAMAAANANVMSSELGDVKIGNPKKTTKWKDIAESLRPVCKTMSLIDRELVALRFDTATIEAEGLASAQAALDQRIEALRAQVRLFTSFNNFDDLVESFTKLGDPPVNRPRSWTKDLDADEET